MLLKERLNQPLLTQRRVLILGLLLVSAGIICNPWILTYLFSADGILSSRSVRIIWAFQTVSIFTGLILVISRSFVTLFNIFVGLFFTIVLLYGTERLFYRLNHPPTPVESPPAPAVIREGIYIDDFFRQDPLLGYKPRPGIQADSVKKLGDETIYDVVYSIDHYSRRITPAEYTVQPDRFILFFGGSFTFGEGLNDNETLPFFVAKMAPHYRAYNYGFSGYGPQQMLAKLESNDLAEEVPEPRGMVIYTFIDAHVERAIGSMYVHNNWGSEMPYYTQNWQGKLVRKGNLTSGRPIISSLFWFLGQSEIAKYYRVNIPATLTSTHYGRAARIIAEARDIFQAKYESDDFYVVIYPDEGDYFEDIAPHFKQLNLRILNYEERIKLDSDEGLSIVGDGHPTAKAHQIVAGWIVEDLGIGDNQE